MAPSRNSILIVLLVAFAVVVSPSMAARDGGAVVISEGHRGSGAVVVHQQRR